MPVPVNGVLAGIDGPGSEIDEWRGGGTYSCGGAGWDEFDERCELDPNICVARGGGAYSYGGEARDAFDK